MTQNPYETPRYDSSEQSVPELTYYQTVTTRLTVREYWNLSRNWSELIVGLVFKFLYVPLPATHAVAAGQKFRRVEPDQVSEAARRNLEPVVDEALALGMQYAFSYSFFTVGTIEAMAVALQSDDGCALMSIVYFRHWNALTIDERVRASFVSLPVDGRILVTAGCQPDLQRPPSYEAEFYPGLPLPALLARHRVRLAELKTALTPIQDLTQLEQILVEHEQEEFEFILERGIYREIDARRVERLRRIAATVTPPTTKVKRQPALKWIGFIGLTVLLISLFMLPDPVFHPVQARFWTVCVLFSLSGVAITWLLRLVLRERVAV